MFLEIFDKLIKREMQKYLIYISIQPPESILWRSIDSGHNMSASQHHPNCQAWRWQHYVMGLFSSARTGKFVRREGTMDGAKYRRILDENLFEPAMNLKLGRRFTFQEDNDPKHKAKATRVAEEEENKRSWVAQSMSWLDPNLNLIWGEVQWHQASALP